MTKENILKHYKRFCFLASGKFNERDFDQHLKDENGEAKHIMGKMSPQRVQLIMSDAQANKETLERKFPWLLETNQPVLKKEADK